MLNDACLAPSLRIALRQAEVLKPNALATATPDFALYPPQGPQQDRFERQAGLMSWGTELGHEMRDFALYFLASGIVRH